MSHARIPAPLHRDAMALTGVLLQELSERTEHPPLRERLAHAALRLLESITLALRSDEPHGHLRDADESLQILRTHLSLAQKLHLLEDDTYLAFVEQGDKLGRQLGGWLRRLHEAP